MFVNYVSVPRSAPAHVQGHNTSSTSLEVTWSDVLFPDQLGIIRGYRVVLSRTDALNFTLSNVSVPISPRTFQMTGLDKYTSYTVLVAAFTKKGIGTFSSGTSILTDEDSE